MGNVQQPVTVMASIRVNIAAAHALLDDFDRAQSLVLPLVDTQQPLKADLCGREAVLLLVYVALRRGDTAEARNLLIIYRLAPGVAEM